MNCCSSIHNHLVVRTTSTCYRYCKIRHERFVAFTALFSSPGSFYRTTTFGAEINPGTNLLKSNRLSVEGTLGCKYRKGNSYKVGWYFTAGTKISYNTSNNNFALIVRYEADPCRIQGINPGSQAVLNQQIVTGSVSYSRTF